LPFFFFFFFLRQDFGKSFEAFFGGVTCLPGCFSAYRIKSPKTITLASPTPATADFEIGKEGSEGKKADLRREEWVPILANPRLVAAYAETDVDTLHRKNLLLLGEDRYVFFFFF
jgi:chitin synthase